MSTILDFSREENLFFTGDYRDHLPGITAEFSSPKVFRVGSYSGSECDRQFQSFPTPPDSPVLAELTSAGNRERQQQRLQQHGNLRVGAVSVQNTFSHPHPGGYIPGDNTSLTGAQNSHTMDMELALLESLLYSNGTSEPMERIIEPMPYSDLTAYGSDAFSKPDGVGYLSTEFPLNLAVHGCFTNTIDDYNSSPVPSPSPINVKEIFSGDLPNLDDLSLVSAFAQMESEPTMRYGSSSAGEESDIESDTSYALPIDDMQPFNFDAMPSQMTSVMTAPPLYHSHHHNIHPHTHYHHHQQQQQQHQPSPYRQQPYTATTSTSDRTHNYQCRTLHTTLKMLDANTDGIITEEAMPQQRSSCAGPIRKPYRSRPRKQSVTSSDDGCSDEEQAVTTTMGSTVSDRTTPNRNRGRGRREAMKGNHLWEFIRDLLKSESYCPKFIRWEDRESGVFRFVNSEAVANMWGRKKNNPQMTYEKLSRAMRYYYKREILERVDGRRLVYKFGKNADGWREAAGLQ